MRKKLTDYEKVMKRLFLSWKHLKTHPKKHTMGIDGVSIFTFGKEERKNIKKLRDSLSAKRFSFKKMKPVDIGNRQILVCTVEDRIVSRSILSVLEKHFKKYNSNCDYSRTVIYKNRLGIKNTLNGVPLAAQAILDNMENGYTWVFETDIKKFFDYIPKQKIIDLINKKITDPDLQNLVTQIINFQVEKELVDIEQKDYYEDIGVAQGSAISPLLASIYLYEFDCFIKCNTNYRLVRYVDDFIIQCKTKDEAEQVYKEVLQKLKDMDLDIHQLDVPDPKNGKIKTRIVNALEASFVFLGLNFNLKFSSILDKIFMKKRTTAVWARRTVVVA